MLNSYKETNVDASKPSRKKLAANHGTDGIINTMTAANVSSSSRYDTVS